MHITFIKKLYQKLLQYKQHQIRYIICPPPNLTGTLHLGHLFELFLCDALSIISILFNFKHKMFCIFGFDHAGLYSEILARKISSKYNKKNILNTIRRTSKTCYKSIVKIIKKLKINILNTIHNNFNHDKCLYTLNKDAITIVHNVYNNLYNQGLIYVDNKVVHYDCTLKTALSDLEVQHNVHKTHMYDILYNSCCNKYQITISTTRPETMFYDIGIVCHPSVIGNIPFGTKFKIPLTNKNIPLIIDNSIKTDFGSGFMKLTPCHSINDFYICQKYKHILTMKYVNIIDNSGRIKYWRFFGMHVLEARKHIVSILQNLNLIIKTNYIESVDIKNIRNNDHYVDIILTNQLYININKIYNNMKLLNTYDKDIEKLTNWCISRSSYYGHIIQNSKLLLKKTMVFDTWFSSSLWPLIVCKYLNISNNECSNFILICGRDITLFWIAKMKCMIYQYCNLMPYEKIYIHGILCDKHGKKLSKSHNNVSSIEDYIKDDISINSLRIALLSHNARNNNINFDFLTINKYKKYINKIININKIIKKYILLYKIKKKNIKLNHLKTIVSKWIIKHLYDLKLDDTFNILDIYRYINILYTLTWNIFANQYIEILKTHCDKYLIIDTIKIWKFLLICHYAILPSIIHKLYFDVFKCNILNFHNYNFKKLFTNVINIIDIIYYFSKLHFNNITLYCYSNNESINSICHIFFKNMIFLKHKNAFTLKYRKYTVYIFIESNNVENLRNLYVTVKNRYVTFKKIKNKSHIICFHILSLLKFCLNVSINPLIIK